MLGDVDGDALRLVADWKWNTNWITNVSSRSRWQIVFLGRSYFLDLRGFLWRPRYAERPYSFDCWGVGMLLAQVSALLPQDDSRIRIDDWAAETIQTTIQTTRNEETTWLSEQNSKSTAAPHPLLVGQQDSTISFLRVFFGCFLFVCILYFVLFLLFFWFQGRLLSHRQDSLFQWPSPNGLSVSWN